MTGDNGDYAFNGQVGYDIFASLGGADDFFVEDGDGDDTILGFETGITGGDSIGIWLFGFSDFNDLLNSTSQNGSDVFIQMDVNDSLTLANLQVNDLYWDDFIV